MQGSATDWILAIGATAAAVVGVLSIVRYQWLTSKYRAQDLARLNTRESILNAIYAYQARYDKWPSVKSDLVSLVRLSEDQIRWFGEWDCRMKSANRSETVVRYAIRIGQDWFDWDAKLVQPLQQVNCRP